MSSIPLVATTIQQPTSPLDNALKAASLRDMVQRGNFEQGQQQIQQQQIQQGDIALQDQKALSAAQQEAYANWDGKDYRTLQSQLPRLAVKHGASVKAVGALQNQALEVQKSYSDIAKNDAETGSKNIETLKNKWDMAVGGLNAIKEIPDDKLAAMLPQEMAALGQQGLLPPQVVQTAAQVAQGSPAEIRQEIDNLAKHFMSQSQRAAAAKSAADIAKTQAETQNDAAELPLKQAASANAQSALKTKTEWLFNHPGKTENDYNASIAAQKSGAEANARVGAEERVAKYNFDLNQGMLPPELKGVAPHLVAPAAAQYEKASTEYAGAKAAQDEMTTIIADARAGNKVAYSYAPTTGVLTINSANGVKRVNMAEIRSYSNAGSVVDRVAGFFGKQISGASIPKDILDDMQQVHDDLGKNSQSKYANQVQATNATYGSKFSPQEFSKPQAQSQPIYATNPQTKERVMTTDGGKTWQPAR